MTIAVTLKASENKTGIEKMPQRYNILHSVTFEFTQ